LQGIQDVVVHRSARFSKTGYCGRITITITLTTTTAAAAIISLEQV
jgi:hypothetical protein